VDDEMSIGGRNILLGVGYLVTYVALDARSFVQPLLKLGIAPWNTDAGLKRASPSGSERGRATRTAEDCARDDTLVEIRVGWKPQRI
jgi:hypothetical protein